MLLRYNVWLTVVPPYLEMELTSVLAGAFSESSELRD